MTPPNRLRPLLLGIMTLALNANQLLAQAAPSSRFAVSFTNEQSAEPLDGCLLLILATDPSAEPRLQISNSVHTQILFGLDVDTLKPGQSATLDDAAFAYPIPTCKRDFLRLGIEVAWRQLSVLAFAAVRGKLDGVAVGAVERFIFVQHDLDPSSVMKV
jgi:hypothetical protein